MQSTTTTLEFLAAADDLREKFRAATDVLVRASIHKDDPELDAALALVLNWTATLAVKAMGAFPDWRARVAALDGRGWSIAEVALLRDAADFLADVDKPPSERKPRVASYMTALSVLTAERLVARREAAEADQE